MSDVQRSLHFFAEFQPFNRLYSQLTFLILLSPTIISSAKLIISFFYLLPTLLGDDASVYIREFEIARVKAQLQAHVKVANLRRKRKNELFKSGVLTAEVFQFFYKAINRRYVARPFAMVGARSSRYIIAFFFSPHLAAESKLAKFQSPTQ